jgi:predicted porin
MKKTLVALAAVAATSAFAQVSLTGALGFDYGRHAGTTGFENADAGSTNLAFTSIEDLGGGLKAKVYMQQRYNATSGANANSSGRALQNVYLNLSGGFGSISYGRILTGNLGAFDAFGEYGTNSGQYGDIENVGNRHDNVIAYSSPKFNGLSVDLATTVNPGATPEYSYARITYSAGPFAASYGQDKNVANVATGTNKAIGLSYDLKSAKVFLLNGDNMGVKNTVVGVAVPMGKATLKASTTSGDSDRITSVGADYALSKTTGLFADFASKGAGASSNYRLGFRTSF